MTTDRTRADLGEYAQAIEESRQRARTQLHGPTSALAAVARHDVAIGARVRFGPDTAADVRLAGMDRTVEIEARADGFLIDGVPTLPRNIPAGRYQLRLSHQGYPAVVILDAESPRLREDVDLRWFAVDPRYRVRGRLEPDEGEVVIASTAS